MIWHEKVLNKNAKKAADSLSKIVADDFYLAGGTALALYFGHRISLDLDFFSLGNKLLQSERFELIESLKKSVPELEINENRDGTCHLSIFQTSISLFHYPYKLLKKADACWKGIPVASLEDLAAMKLSAIIGRGSKKDFVDIYQLGKTNGLQMVLDGGEKKFRDHPNFLLQACRALVYFEDAEKEPMPKMFSKIKWEEVKSYLNKEIPKHLKGRLK